VVTRKTTRRAALAAALALAGGWLVAHLWQPPTPALTGAPAGPPDAASAAGTSGAPAVRAALADAGRQAGAHTAVRIDARWGSGPGQLGHRHDPEGAPEGPMSLVAGRAGDTWVLDQANGRAVHFDAAGHALSAVRVSETAQDLAVGPAGNLYVLDRIGKGELTLYDGAGNAITTDGVTGGPIREGGAVTGLFVDRGGVYLEREHTDAVRVAGADGRFDPGRPVVPGRPSRDGSAFVRAALAGRRAAVALVTVFDRDGAQRWQRPVTFPRGVLQLALLDTDLEGHLYLGAEVADESPAPPYPLENLATVVVRVALSDGGAEGVLTLPAAEAPEEIFRSLAVSDDGEVVQLLAWDGGVRVSGYRFP
jgi:hypothetical protein